MRTDWQAGLCRVLVGCRLDNQPSAEFRLALHTVLKRVQNTPMPGLDGVVAVASNDCLICWEHWTDADAVDDGAISGLGELVSVVLLTDAKPGRVAGELFAPDPGRTVGPGESLNMQFVRRSLFPK